LSVPKRSFREDELVLLIRFRFQTLVLSLAACIAMSFGSVASAEDDPNTAAKPVSFYRQVQPILQRQCAGCHQPAKASGKLTLTSHAALLAGGEQGHSVVPGKPDESLLLEVIVGDPPSMPPKGPALSMEHVELIRTWISEGATDDTPATLQDTISPDHPPTYVAPPVIAAIAYSPDGQYLAVSGFREVLIHKSDGSELVSRLVGRSQKITSIQFSPDSQMLAVTGGNPGLFGEVQFWNVPEKRLERTATLALDTTFGGRFSDDGALYACGAADNSARILRTSDGEQTLKFDAHADYVTAAAFSVDATHLVTISRDRSMKLVIVETGQFVDNITSITPGALRGGLLALRRHPKADELLVGGADGEPKLYRMFRTQTRVIGDDFNRIRSYPVMPGRIFSLDFSVDGSLFVAGSSTGDKGYARIYKTNEGTMAFELPGVSRGVFAAAFAPDGKSVAVGGFDGVVRLYSTENGQLVKEFVPVPLQPAVAATR
jgi:WD40 repeat protein